MKKVYYGTNSVAFCSASAPAAMSHGEEEAALVIESEKVDSPLRDMLRLTNLQRIFETAKSVVFILPDPELAEEAFEAFSAQFDCIAAAGGIVENPDGDILMIYRNGHWDLPKGKQEAEEELSVCAVREVQEECGVCGLQPDRFLGYTYHIYETAGRYVLKQTAWFVMRHDADESLVPQQEEGITDVRWVSRDTLAPYLENTYPSVRDILRKII